MLKSSTIAITTLGTANASRHFLSQAKSTDTCWQALDLIKDQASLYEQWSDISNWEDTEWDVREANSNAYWFPEDGSSNSVAYNGSNAWQIQAMTPAEIQAELYMPSHGKDGDYRPGDDADFADVSVWGAGIHMDDVAQGEIGDCYFLAASALAATVGNTAGDGKHIARKVMPLDATPDAGIFPFTFFMAGRPTRFFVDSYLPQQSRGWYISNVFSRLGRDGSYWVPLFEKAWAKQNGNYNHITSGSVGEAMYAFTGAPYATKIKYTGGTRYSNNYDDFSELWSAVTDALSKGYTVSLGTVGQGDDSQKTTYQLAQSHAYQVLDTRDCGSTQIIQLRNPWRSEWFISANHDAATVSCIGADYNEDNDGVFWVNQDQVTADISSYDISYIEWDWPVRFMELEDDQAAGYDYQFTINNPVQQDVFVQINTDNERATHCASSSQVLIGYNWKILQGGTAHHLYENLAAGEHTIRVRFNWHSGNTRRNYAIKTYAEQDVPFTFNGEDARCYIFSDAIGNPDFEVNAVSYTCGGRRAPADYWDSDNHMPGSGGSSNNGYTEPEAAPAEEEPEETTPETTTEEPAASNCEGTAVESLNAGNAMGGADGGAYAYYYGLVQCEGSSYLTVKFQGPGCYRVTGSATLTGSGAVGGDIDNSACTVNGEQKDCNFPMVTQGEWTGAAIQVTGGWGLGLGLSVGYGC